jgi:DnaJ-class molecular chaperone
VGRRVFLLTVNALESISGTTRDVVVVTPAGERRVNVRIPSGINSGASFKVECPATEEFPEQVITIKVDLEDHPYVERKGLNIILTLPITIGEAISGSEIEIPTVKGSAKVRVPPGWSEGKKLRMKGLGIDTGKSVGDLYIKPKIILPDAKASPEVIREISKAVDDLYLKNVRAKFPKKLR